MLLIVTVGLFVALFVKLYKERKEKELAKEAGQRRVFIGRSAVAESQVEPSQRIIGTAFLAASFPLLLAILQPNPLVSFIPLILVSEGLFVIAALVAIVAGLVGTVIAFIHLPWWLGLFGYTDSHLILMSYIVFVSSAGWLSFASRSSD